MPAARFRKSSSPKQPAAIIGAGIGGIATAVRLALAGHKVTVFEAQESFGGKMHQLVLPGGYRFDGGPSLFTLPHLVDELFRLAGRDPQEHFRYQRLDPITQYFFPDGIQLTAWADEEKFAQEVEQKLGVPAAEVRAFLKRSQAAYDATADTFLQKSLHKASTYLSPDVLKALAALPTLGLTSTMHQRHAAAFPQEPRLVQLFDRFATYNGSDPYQAPATLSMIPHLEHGLGAFYPEGGIYAIAESLVKLAEELGVQFRYNEPVEEILTAAGRVTGLRTSQEVYDFGLIISNMDVVPTYRHLLRGQPAPERTLRQPRSSSALIFYWGVGRRFPQLGVHNIFFSEDYKREFDAIFQDKTVSADPTVYVNITSGHTPTDAPEGHENWFVMVNVPHDQGQDWPTLVARTRQAVLARVSKALGTDVGPLIRAEHVWDPPGIAARTSSFGGALYGSSSNNTMAAFLRHPNFSQQLEGLYFCGGSVHPGGGIPLCLLSARIVADLITR
ncbi:phytoene desaturase [Hymenobacter taeanensis]|uniref:Phytoene desaturase n=1 Tax=Hymenobacter taeanensis TaxID=2735321 RepID=A0A6M6BDX9_9BACT|nr:MULTISPECIES: 1-hydroxycarotenoid 3,4-desaturase CrtD [Hymenobacter]QJX46741.1 phytoene desaturase [Hymenobacter taeanensis]UOQ80610.1 phytoene desaturase family protein [Hymenobacter sp. 5414T-23]